MKKSGLLIRAGLPVFALLGAVTFGSESYAYDGGKMVFKWIGVTSDVAVGYRNDNIKFRELSPTTWRDVLTGNADYFAGSPGPYRALKVTRAQQDLVQVRGKTTIQAHDGALVNSFLEVMGQMGFVADQKRKFYGHWDALPNGVGTGFRPRFHFGRGHGGHDHDHNHNVTGSETGKASGTYDGHIIVGYDIAKLKNPWKDFAFKPFFGHYAMRHRSGGNLKGYHKPHVQVVGNQVFDQNGNLTSSTYANGMYPTLATVKTSAKWHGWVAGFNCESTWGSHTIWMRPEYRWLTEGRFWTQSRMFGVSSKEKTISKRGKNSSGYQLAAGYKYQMDPDWNFFADGAWTYMTSKNPKHKDWVHNGHRIDNVTLRSYNFMGGVGFSY